MHPYILDIIEGAHSISSSLASKLSQNVTMFAETYDNDIHYICKAVSLPTSTPATILEMLNCNWCNRILEDDPPILKKVLTILNFCGLPTNPVDHINHVDMQKKSLHRRERSH